VGGDGIVQVGVHEPEERDERRADRPLGDCVRRAGDGVVADHVRAVALPGGQEHGPHAVQEAQELGELGPERAGGEHVVRLEALGGLDRDRVVPHAGGPRERVEAGDELGELRLHGLAREPAVGGGGDGARRVRRVRVGEVRVQKAEQRDDVAAERSGVDSVGSARGRRAAHEGGAAGGVGRVGDGGELGVGRVEGGLDGLPLRLEARPRAGLDADVLGGGEHERLPARHVDVLGEDLVLPERAEHVADEQLVRLERHLLRLARGRGGALADDQLERLVLPEEELLRVAVRPRVREKPGEPQKHTEPALLPRLQDRGRQPLVVDGAVHPRAGPEEDALPESVVGAGGGRQVDREVRDRIVRHGDRARDDPADAEVGGEVAVRALEQLEAEVQLALGDALSEEILEARGHERLRGAVAPTETKGGEERKGTLPG